ncbi:hypothetical protein MTR67_049127 [Solanum verrucosum]|uniref:Uncharacterized protein n=1 Tax=Solanum verrucosum TaxID=315347 RepID=A0AAF0ZX57_SOLVR|nr:hypothetical protein MTR67_049127 [Solanum verrucosum]
MDLSTAISLSKTLSLLSPISPSSSSLPPFSLFRRSHHLRRCNLSRSFCLPSAVQLSTSREDDGDEMVEIGGSEFEEEVDYAEDEDTLDVDSLEREAQLVVREFSDSLSRQLIIVACERACCFTMSRGRNSFLEARKVNMQSYKEALELPALNLVRKCRREDIGKKPSFSLSEGQVRAMEEFLKT